MEWIRAFVALNLPVAVVKDLAAVQRDLRAAAERGGARVSWVPAPNMHVTLKFLGNIDREAVYALRDRLGRELEGRASFPVSVRGVGVFPDVERPRVLWAGVEDLAAAGTSTAAPLARLAADVDGWLDDLGYEPERRPFHGHVTLGRIKEPPARGPFWTETALREQRCAPIEVVLYSSVLQRQGAEYEALARYPLAGVAAVGAASVGAASVGAATVQAAQPDEQDDERDALRAEQDDERAGERDVELDDERDDAGVAGEKENGHHGG